MQTNEMHVGKCFIDTNILLYAHDTRSREKEAIAKSWLRLLADKRVAVVNLQCLNEVANALLKKKWFGRPELVFRIVDDLALFGDTQVGWNEVAIARKLHETTRYSWWDCLLLASALELGCSHFLSEDLQDGHQIGGLTIINPFLHAPETILGTYQD